MGINRWSALQDILPSLQTLAVSATLLKSKPSLIEAFVAAAKRCRKSKDESVAQLLNLWKEVSRDKQDSALVGTLATACPMNTVTSSECIASSPTMMTSPARPLKLQPTRKLGRVFAAMREQRANEEPYMIDLSKQLASELANCGNAHSLRLLFPKLNGLGVTGSVLQQSPSVLEALVAAAKRCRKSKDATVIHLLSSWRKVHIQQQELEERLTFKREEKSECEVDHSLNNLDLMKSYSSETQNSPKASFLHQTLPAAHVKQAKITSFLSNSSCAAAGG